MRVALADPPAFTPAYDHALASALARAGADVELVTSRFRFGEIPEPAAYERSESFYPLSSRLFRRSRLRLPVKALEHTPGMLALLRRRPDVLHLPMARRAGARPLLLRSRVPDVFTAHDLLPRRTARKLSLWRTLLSRFDRVVVHSEQGRERARGPRRRRDGDPASGLPERSDRADDGRTLLCLGTIRPYKGSATRSPREADRRGAPARRRRPARAVNGYREQGGRRREWRLGYLPQREVERALGEATVAPFPYRPELDQSGALLQALGPVARRSPYDVGGIASRSGSSGAGRVVAAGDVEALAAAADAARRSG
jgi:hypothetical protein